MYSCSYNILNQEFNSGFLIDSYNQSLSVCPTEGPKSYLIDNFLVDSFNHMPIHRQGLLHQLLI